MSLSWNQTPVHPAIVIYSTSILATSAIKGDVQVMILASSKVAVLRGIEPRSLRRQRIIMAVIL